MGLSRRARGLADWLDHVASLGGSATGGGRVAYQARRLNPATTFKLFEEQEDLRRVWLPIAGLLEAASMKIATPTIHLEEETVEAPRQVSLGASPASGTTVGVLGHG